MAIENSLKNSFLVGNIPPPFASKIDWPWSDETDSSVYDVTIQWPKISVITPSYNQGEFLEETLRSVILQNYPNMEYFVVDGGSTDKSVEIIKKYDRYITKWVSEKDEGQSDALNKGFEWCTGDLICFINSDDFFYPGAFYVIAKEYLTNTSTEASILSGNTIFVDKDSIPQAFNSKSFFPYQTPADLTLIDHLKWFLPQPSMFFIRSKILDSGYFLMKELHYTMDRELIYRMLKGGKLLMINQDIASYRLHEHSKSIGNTTFLHQYLEAPKAFKGFYTGIPAEDKRRKRVMRWRMAQGYMHAARKKSKGLKSIRYFMNSVYYRPNYLKMKFFWYSLIKNILGRNN